MNKLVNLDLGNFNLDGNVSITSPTVGTLNISSGSGKITGTLAVSTPGATVNNSVVADGGITISDVSNNTWNENVSGNSIVFEDPNAETNFVIGTGQSVASLTLNTPAKVTNNGTIVALTVQPSATGTTVNNDNGSIANVTVSKGATVEVTGVAPDNVTGEGTLSAQEVAIPQNVTVTATDHIGLGYLTNRVTKGSQLAIDYNTLVKVFTSDNLQGTTVNGYDHKGTEITDVELPENLVTRADGLALDLKVKEGKLVLGKGTKMTKDLFDAIKAQDGTAKDQPYRVTITKANNSKEKIAKVAFYADGTAKLEAISAPIK